MNFNELHVSSTQGCVTCVADKRLMMGSRAAEARIYAETHQYLYKGASRPLTAR